MVRKKSVHLIYFLSFVFLQFLSAEPLNCRQILSFLKGAVIELLKHLLFPHQCTSYSFGEWCVLWVFPKGLTKQTSADRDRLTLLFFSICCFLMESGLEFLKLCYVGK